MFFVFVLASCHRKEARNSSYSSIGNSLLHTLLFDLAEEILNLTVKNRFSLRLSARKDAD